MQPLSSKGPRLVPVVSSGSSATARAPESPVTVESPPPEKQDTFRMAHVDRVDPEVLQAAVQRASERRLEEMRSLASLPLGAPAAPEDGTLDPDAFHMVIRTGRDKRPVEVDLLFAKEMLRIAAQEGASVVLRTHDPDAVLEALPPSHHDAIRLVQVHHSGEVWVEDQGEVYLDGSLAYPALVEELGFDLSRVTREDRNAREAEFRNRGVSSHGAMSWGSDQTLTAELALANGTPAREMFGYVEGGNLLMGTRSDGSPYALVARDAVGATRGLLESGLGRPPSEEEVMLALSRDLGVPPEAVIPVEQPGDFHLDMYVSLLPGGKVLFNDAAEALRLQESWMRSDHEAARPQPPSDSSPQSQAEFRDALSNWEAAGEEMEVLLEKLHKQTETLVAFEPLVLRDLENRGLEVHRIPGAFKGDFTDSMNFLNAELGRGADGKTFSIVLGGDPRAEEMFRSRLEALFGDDAPRLHFLDRALTPLTLSGFGGISCRVKSSGALAFEPAADSGPTSELR